MIKKVTKGLKSIMIVMFCVFLAIPGIPSVYAGGVYFEDFENMQEIGTTGTPWTYSSNNGNYVPVIVKDGKLTRDVFDANGKEEISHWKGSLVTCRAFTPSGNYKMSFDLSIAFGYGNDTSCIEFKFNQKGSTPWPPVDYVLRFKFGEGVTLLKNVAWDSKQTYTFGTVKYDQMPTAQNQWRHFKVEIENEVNEKGNVTITVDITNKSNGLKTRLFDRAEDKSGTAQSAGGPFGVYVTSYCQFRLDNVLVNNDGYIITDAMFFDKGNNQVSVKAKSTVASDFQSGTMVAAAYDENDCLVAISTKPYTEANVIDKTITYEDIIYTQGEEITKVKVFLWNALASMIPYASSSDCIIDPLGDIDSPPYIPADVHRPDVVQMAQPVQLPEYVRESIIRTYPDGKLKALLMSFDDSGVGDYNLIVPYLNEKGLKAQFSINYKPMLLGVDTEGRGIWLRTETDEDREYFKREMNKLYEGHEIANHTLTHKSDYNLSKENIRKEIGESKAFFEYMFNKEVAGYIKAGGSNPPDPEVASSEWRNAYIKYVGYRYVRNAPLQYPGTSSLNSFTFPVPTDFFDWDPTIKITEDPNSSFTRIDLLNRFISMDPQNEMRLFFGWGHGYELHNFDWNNYTITTNQNYLKFKEFCDIAAANKDIIWNPTVIEYVDYINALRMIQVSKGESEGMVTIHNPSNEITVWLRIEGVDTPIEPNETIDVQITL